MSKCMGESKKPQWRYHSYRNHISPCPETTYIHIHCCIYTRKHVLAFTLYKQKSFVGDKQVITHLLVWYGILVINTQPQLCLGLCNNKK